MNIVNPKQVYSYGQLEKDIEKLSNKYASFLKVKIIGQSVDQRNIYALKLGTGETEIFINGAHHAREWLTTSLIMHMIETYSRAFEQRDFIGEYNTTEILSKTSIWFVPMVNPDGVTLVQDGHLSVKDPEKVLMLNDNNEDFSAWKANIRGVDLNRQYPADWDNIQDNYGKPAPMMYKGPFPLSEPEVKAMYAFTLEHDFKTAVSYHSSGEELFWKYKSKGRLLQVSKRIATMISEKTGYKLVDPGPNPSGGGFTDWFLDSLKKPGFTPEISPLVGPRPVPIRHYDQIWKDNREIGLMLAEEAYLR